MSVYIISFNDVILIITVTGLKYTLLNIEILS